MPVAPRSPAGGVARNAAIKHAAPRKRRCGNVLLFVFGRVAVAANRTCCNRGRTRMGHPAREVSPVGQSRSTETSCAEEGSVETRLPGRANGPMASGPSRRQPLTAACLCQDRPTHFRQPSVLKGQDRHQSVPESECSSRDRKRDEVTVQLVRRQSGFGSGAQRE